MLKALKTLLKDDIINPNTKGGFIMGVQQALTTEQVSILLWLKAIDDFKGEGYETATFNEKYDAFEAVEDTGFTREEYDSYVGFWKRNGIIDEDKHTQEYSISKKGKKLFKQLDEMKESSDKEIADTLNNLSKASDLSAIHTFVKNHPQEILLIISLALQVVQIVVTI